MPGFLYSLRCTFFSTLIQSFVSLKRFGSQRKKMHHRPKLYVGCSLYNATPEFRGSIETLKNLLRDQFEVLEFLGFKNGTPEEIVQHDLAQVRTADIFLAICDIPSTGLGIEIGSANALGKKILLAASSDDVSNMVRGNYSENKNSQFIVYSSFEDLYNKLLDFTQN